MYEFLTKKGQLVAFGLGILLTIIYAFSVTSGLEEFSALPKDQQGETTIFNFGLYAVIGLTAICAILMLVWGVWQVIQNPKGSMKGIIALVALVVLAGIFYAMAVPETSGPVYKTAQKFGITGNQSKMISAMINTVVSMAGIAALAFVVSEIRNLFK